MILRIYVRDINTVRHKLKSGNDELEKHRWKNDDIRTDVNFAKLSKAEVDEFEKILKKAAEKKDKWYGPIYRKFTEWQSLLTGQHESDKPVKKLELLPAAMKAFYADMPHKWIFRESGDQSINPYLITNIQYHKAHYTRDGSYIPARVSLHGKAYKRGSKQSFEQSWWAGSLGQTVDKILLNVKLFPETEASVKQYRETFNRFTELQSKVGYQMEAHGEASSVSDRYWYSDKAVQMVREGIPAKVILDDSVDEDADRGSRTDDTYIIDEFWGEIPNRNGMADLDDDDMLEMLEDQGDEPNRVELPIHPYLKVFDMEKHNYVTIHARNLDEYNWDKTLINKLVLKEEDKDLISLLMNQTGVKSEDIIRGKMPGVIVIATGPPGIGKTLTAEVFSEVIEKPLYTVQCSQLGLDVKQIESNLGDILSKAARWGAILLIDEADVYIRQRGEDINQNAIVGVFLRLIEYYPGILFMTSNRGDVIDDAIISRATAWIRYELPDKSQLRSIWEVLGTQYGAAFSSKELDSLAKKFEGVSGRSVRNMLKLAKLLAAGEKITVKMIEQIAKYQALEVDIDDSKGRARDAAQS